MDKFKYLDGRVILTGDKVEIYPARIAKVDSIVEPGSELAKLFSFPEGGFFLKFEDGDQQFWHEADEDIKLIKRSKPAEK